MLGKHYEIAYPGRSWSSARRLRQPPLYAKWAAEKAHFTQAFGWERPLFFGAEGEPVLTFDEPDWFERVAVEVAQAHQKAALFDQSTFGKIDVAGPDAERFLNRVCANDMARGPGRAIYSSMLNARGGIESDLTAVRISDELFHLSVGTTAIRRDLAWLRRHLDGERVTLRDVTEERAIIGLMGPEATAIAERVGAGALNQLGYFRSGEATIVGALVRGVRLSYVGETGWEISCRAEDAAAVYEALYAEGARPAGALAQTSMRIEKRFLSFGHDIDADVTPLDAGLDVAVAWETEFIGREALLRLRGEGRENRLVSLIFDDPHATPLGEEPVRLDGAIAGKTTSAAFGYRVGRPVAIADLSLPEARIDGATVSVDVGGATCLATVRHGAVFDPTGARMRRG